MASYNLQYDDHYDVVMGIHDSKGKLIATGARDGYILKMIAVSQDSQASEIYSELITSLVANGFEAGHESFLIFTKPELYHAFTALNFHLLSVTSKVALLEYGSGIKDYLRKYKSCVRKGDNGAVIMNCNPFTKGHQYLVEQAAAKCDHLYVFVVEEDSSSFPFRVRYRLVEKGVAHLDNVTVLPTGYYAVSRGTFPSYFIDAETDVSLHQLETDLNIFVKYIAPFFNITTRFAGTEPYCKITGAYNSGMRSILPLSGISFEEIERLKTGCDAISASKVRRLLIEGRAQEAVNYLPPSTMEYINSDEFNNEINTSQMSGRH